MLVGESGYVGEEAGFHVYVILFFGCENKPMTFSTTDFERLKIIFPRKVFVRFFYKIEKFVFS